MIHHRGTEDTEEKGLQAMRTVDKQDPLTFEIIGAAIDAHRVLGPGLLINFNVEALRHGIKRVIL